MRKKKKPALPHHQSTSIICFNGLTFNGLLPFKNEMGLIKAQQIFIFLELVSFSSWLLTCYGDGEMTFPASHSLVGRRFPLRESDPEKSRQILTLHDCVCMDPEVAVYQSNNGFFFYSGYYIAS